MAELSQLPDIVDLKFVAGDTFRIRVRVINPEDAEPVELTDYEFEAEILTEDDRGFAAAFEVAPDPAAPTEAVILTLPPSVTAVLPGGTLGNGVEFRGIWDLEVTFPNTDVRTVAKGTVFCYIDVTNSDVTP